MKAGLSMPKELQEMMEELAALENTGIDEVAGEMLDAGAEVALEGIRRRVPVDTGDLKETLEKGLIKREGNVTSIKIGQSDGKASDFASTKVSKRQAVKANVNEYGSSSMPARSYVRSTLHEDKSKIMRAMKAVLKKKLGELE